MWWLKVLLLISSLDYSSLAPAEENGRITWARVVNSAPANVQNNDFSDYDEKFFENHDYIYVDTEDPNYQPPETQEHVGEPPQTADRRTFDLLYHLFKDAYTHENDQDGRLQREASTTRRPTLIEAVFKTIDDHIIQDLRDWVDFTNPQNEDSTSVVKTPVATSLQPADQSNSDLILVTDELGQQHIVSIDDIVNSLGYLDEQTLTDLLLGPSVAASERVSTVVDPPSPSNAAVAVVPTSTNTEIRSSPVVKVAEDSAKPFAQQSEQQTQTVDPIDQWDSDVYVVQDETGKIQVITLQDIITSLALLDHESRNSLLFNSPRNPLPVGTPLVNAAQTKAFNPISVSSSSQLVQNVDQINLTGNQNQNIKAVGADTRINSGGISVTDKSHPGKIKSIVELSEHSHISPVYESPPITHTVSVQQNNYDHKTTSTSNEGIVSLAANVRNPQEKSQGFSQSVYSSPPAVSVIQETQIPIVNQGLFLSQQEVPKPLTGAHAITRPAIEPVPQTSSSGSFGNTLSSWLSQMVGGEPATPKVTPSPPTTTPLPEAIQLIAEQPGKGVFKEVTVPLPRPIHFQHKSQVQQTTRQQGVVQAPDNASPRIDPYIGSNSNIDLYGSSPILSRLPANVQKALQKQINNVPRFIPSSSATYKSPLSATSRADSEAIERVDLDTSPVAEGSLYAKQYLPQILNKLPSEVLLSIRQQVLNAREQAVVNQDTGVSASPEQIDRSYSHRPSYNTHTTSSAYGGSSRPQLPFFDMHFLLDLVKVHKAGKNNFSIKAPLIGNPSKFVDTRHHGYHG